MKSIHLLLVAVLFATACSDKSAPEAKVDGHGHGHEEGHAESEAEAEPVEGPHGGRLLEDGDFAIELTMFESGVPPEFRAYAFEDKDPLPPDAVKLNVELERLGGAKEQHAFAPERDYLRGQAEVREPHSYEVTVRAEHDGETHEWHFDSFEGRTQISQAAADKAGVKVEAAGPASIRETLALHGTVVPDPARVHRIRPRFPGMLRELRKGVGDSVAAGEVLAVVEANESMQRYNIVAPAAGVVVTREANPGVPVGDEVLISLVDLSRVWVEFAAFPHDLDRLKVGQAVVVTDVDGHHRTDGTIASIAPVGSPASQSMTVRVVLPNPEGFWRPGLFAAGNVSVATTQAPLAVRRSALQTFRDWTVVFEQVGEEYEVRPLELGRSDGEWIEVLGGLAPGARYVSGNSFLIKADIEKAGASHDH